MRRLGNDAMRSTFDVRDLGFTASFATHVHKAGGVVAVRRQLTRSMAYVARYLRQQMPWVDALPLHELQEWAEAAGSIVEAENGKGGGGDDGGGGAGMPGLGPSPVPE